MVRAMRTGSVIVDVAIDQGGCVETGRPTTHHEPTFITEGVVHYCVANMPGAVPRTSTKALNNATLPYLLALADLGPIAAMRHDAGLRAGLTVHRGAITEPAVAAALGRPFVPPAEALG
jgi:alanine dehydrogenase